MSRNITFAPGEYYHLYNRGTDRRLIFTGPKERDRFLALLYLCNSEKTIHVSDYRGSSLPQLLALERGAPLVDLCAYCLMPNHVHLLVRECRKGGASSFMQKLMTGYTMYFNMRHERTGVLFQGRFKAQHADKDTYLKYLITYIHLNPIKLIEPAWKETGIKNHGHAQKFLDSYRHSSLLDYCGYDRPEKAIINMNALPDYFEIPKDFKKNVKEWLDFPSSP